MSELEHVITSFSFEKLDDNRFRSRSPAFGWRRIYGGLLLAHAVRAAQLDIGNSDQQPHSLHGYFLRPGNVEEPLDIVMERNLDGRTIANRGIRIEQNGKAVFIAQCSFRTPGAGLSHQSPMPHAESPESLPDEAQIARLHSQTLSTSAQTYLRRPKVFELRPVDHGLFVKPDPDDSASSLIWARLRSAGTVSNELVWPLMAYLSDMTVLNASLHPHGRNFFDDDIVMASLDHAVWFHGLPDWSDWVLMSHEAMGNDSGMGLGRTNIHSRKGSLLATIVQQGLIRQKVD